MGFIGFLLCSWHFPCTSADGLNLVSLQTGSIT